MIGPLRTIRNRTARIGWLFVIAQAIIVPALIAVPLVRSWWLTRSIELPKFRNEPLVIAPQYDDERVVTDQQLAMVLDKLRPRLANERAKINHVDHALRMWGAEATFAHPDCLTGRQMRDLLLEHKTFVKSWGDEVKPLLIQRAGGVAVRTAEGKATASHVDHTLAALAEI